MQQSIDFIDIFEEYYELVLQNKSMYWMINSLMGMLGGLGFGRT